MKLFWRARVLPSHAFPGSPAPYYADRLLQGLRRVLRSSRIHLQSKEERLALQSEPIRLGVVRY